MPSGRVESGMASLGSYGMRRPARHIDSCARAESRHRDLHPSSPVARAPSRLSRMKRLREAVPRGKQRSDLFEQLSLGRHVEIQTDVFRASSSPTAFIAMSDAVRSSTSERRYRRRLLGSAPASSSSLSLASWRWTTIRVLIEVDQLGVAPPGDQRLEGAWPADRRAEAFPAPPERCRRRSARQAPPPSAW